MTLSIIDPQHNDALHYAECHHAERQIIYIVMLSVIMLNVVMLSVIMLSVVAPYKYVKGNQIGLLRSHFVNLSFNLPSNSLTREQHTLINVNNCLITNI